MANTQNAQELEKAPDKESFKDSIAHIGYSLVVLGTETLATILAANKIYKLGIKSEDFKNLIIAHQHAIDMEYLEKNAVKMPIESIKYLKN